MILRHTLAAAAAACLATTTQAAVTFTVDSTITSAQASAFTLGEAVTITFTTLDGLGAPNGLNTTDGAVWRHETTDPDNILNAPLWADVTVSGVTGSFVVGTNDPFDSVETGQTTRRRNNFYLSAAAFDGSGIGLFRDGQELDFIDAQIVPSDLVPAFLAGDASQRIESTFVNGIYDFAGATNASVYFYTGGYKDEYIASFDRLTISGALAPVPVPAAGWLLMAGLAGLGVIRRRPVREV